MGMIMFVLKVVFYLPARLFGYNLFRKKVKKGELSNLPSQISYVLFKPSYFVSSKDFVKAYKKCITENTDHLVREVLEGVSAWEMITYRSNIPDASEMSEKQALNYFKHFDHYEDRGYIGLCCTPYVATLIANNYVFSVIDNSDITEKLYCLRERILKKHEREAAIKERIKKSGKIKECDNCGWNEPTIDIDGGCNNCGYNLISLDDAA